MRFFRSVTAVREPPLFLGSYRELRQKYHLIKSGENWVCVETNLVGDALYEIYKSDLRSVFESSDPEFEKTNQELMRAILMMMAHSFQYHFEYCRLKVRPPSSENVSAELNKIPTYLKKIYGMDKEFMVFMESFLKEFQREDPHFKKYAAETIIVKTTSRDCS